MSKISIVREIKAKLSSLRIADNSCKILNIDLPNGDYLKWVGYRQVSIARKDKRWENVFRIHRYPLYSKDIDKDMLDLINCNLKTL